MKWGTQLRTKLVVAVVLVAWTLADLESDAAAADSSTSFTGEKTAWHGFDRYDLLMDQDSLALKPIKAAADEKNGIKGQVKGQWRCVVVVPRNAGTRQPVVLARLLLGPRTAGRGRAAQSGFSHRLYHVRPRQSRGTPGTRSSPRNMDFPSKPAFIGMSRGGVNEYAWATVNPDKVACIYADNPALRSESLLKIGELARNDVPLLHICGSLDFLLQQHSLAVENIYHQLGGRITMMIKEGVPHHPHSLRDPRPIADWIVRTG